MRTPLSMAVVAVLLFVAPAIAKDQVDVISVRLLTKPTSGSNIVELDKNDECQVTASRQGTSVAIAGSNRPACFLLHIKAKRTIGVECGLNIVLMETESSLDGRSLEHRIMVTGCQKSVGQDPQGQAWIKVRIPRGETMFVEVRVRDSVYSNCDVSLFAHECTSSEQLRVFRDGMEQAARYRDDLDDQWRPLGQQHD